MKEKQKYGKAVHTQLCTPIRSGLWTTRGLWTRVPVSYVLNRDAYPTSCTLGPKSITQETLKKFCKDWKAFTFTCSLGLPPT